jgi:hypothetical protein
MFRSPAFVPVFYFGVCVLFLLGFVGTFRVCKMLSLFLALVNASVLCMCIQILSVRNDYFDNQSYTFKWFR